MKRVVALLSLVSLLGLLLLSACSLDNTRGLATQEKDFADFTHIEVAGVFDIEINHSNTYHATITTESSLADYVVVTREGTTLKIFLNPQHSFTDFTAQPRTLKVEIGMPALRGVSLSGGNKATVSGFNSVEELHVSVSGVSSLTLDEMTVLGLDGEVEGGSRLRGNLTTTNLRLTITGTSEVELEGSAEQLFLTISGGSQADLADLALNNANTTLSGLSEATINAQGRLDATLTDASQLYFMGNPIMGTISVSGASTIKHR